MAAARQRRHRDEAFMRRALALARRGRGKVSPNPMVGCVLVRGGRVAAEGWHARFGGPHAEAAALAKAGARARGAVAYVTLEPCRHQGKTPPCTRALIGAGVRRVVVAMRDPNPLVAGKGLAELRRAGVAVSSGLLEADARELNRPFATWMSRGRPYVVLKAGISLDGRIASAAGKSQWITSPAARSLSRRLRAESDAILVGVNTVLKDDSRLTAKRGRNPVRVVLDARLRTPRRARVLDSAAPTILAAAPAARARFPLPASASILRVPARSGRLDLRALLGALAKRGISSLLVEGGSAVHTSFLEAGLVDELRLFIAPKLLGGASAPAFLEGRGFDLAKAPALREARVRRVGPDILVTGLL
jgi:diaminohydroxyphosphoribosylaminopyrimidine deaminase/5-amino-6-(5-phosphoribosylamino)uracil reductase